MSNFVTGYCDCNLYFIFSKCVCLYNSLLLLLLFSLFSKTSKICRDGVLEATALASRPAGVSLALALASEAKSLALALASGAKSLNLKSLALDLKLSWPCWSLGRYCTHWYI